MEIQRICIKNFLAISDATIQLDNRGLVLIQGENLDDTSADSNGTGKSSIVDALSWCLYGVTARGVSGDAVVNRIEKKNCSVVVYLNDNGTRYSIQRTRKHKTLKNQTIVELLSSDGKTFNLSKATEKETQKVINQIMGCSQQVFQAAVYSGQENMIDLPSLTDKNLKMIVEEAAGVDRIEAAYALARQEMNETKNLLDEAEMKRDLYMDSISGGKKLLEESKQSIDEWDKTHKENLAVLEAGLKDAESALEARKNDLKAMDEESIMEAKKTLIDASRDAKKQKSLFMQKLNETNDAIKKNEVAIGMIEAKAKEIGKTIKAYRNNPESFTCPTCGSPLSADKIAEMEQNDSAILKSQLQNLAVVKKAVEKLMAEKHELEEKCGIEVKDTDTSVIEELMDKLNKLSVAKAAVNSAFSQVEIERHKLNQERKAVNPYQNTYDTVTARLKEEVKQFKQFEKMSDNLAEEMKLKKMTVDVFSPAGVRALILDTVTPFLNQRTADYLSILSDGNLTAVWTTLSKTAKGELREKFSIEVSNSKGGDSFTALSGGEKKKVRVATAMALQDLVSSRATKPISLWIADEIDSALDVSGLERLMTILNQKAMERGTVMIISHTNLRDWCSNVITVRKQGGTSTVEVN